MGPALTSWTIRLSLLLFCGAIAFSWRARSARSSALRHGSSGIRLLWTVAFLCFLAHVICAFHYYHQWSHAAAYDETAKQTKEFLGWEFGAGIYFSYLFLLIWGADVAARWCCPAVHARQPGWLRGGIAAYLGFIAFNGAVIFEAGPTRPAGILACLALGGGWLARRGPGRRSNTRQEFSPGET